MSFSVSQFCFVCVCSSVGHLLLVGGVLVFFLCVSLLLLRAAVIS
jgi:hypothetical protein